MFCSQLTLEMNLQVHLYASQLSSFSTIPTDFTVFCSYMILHGLRQPHWTFVPLHGWRSQGGRPPRYPKNLDRTLRQCPWPCLSKSPPLFGAVDSLMISKSREQTYVFSLWVAVLLCFCFDYTWMHGLLIHYTNYYNFLLFFCTCCFSNLVFFAEPSVIKMISLHLCSFFLYAKHREFGLGLELQFWACWNYVQLGYTNKAYNFLFWNFL